MAGTRWGQILSVSFIKNGNVVAANVQARITVVEGDLVVGEIVTIMKE